jgi:hypothetical protein
MKMNEVFKLPMDSCDYQLGEVNYWVADFWSMREDESSTSDMAQAAAHAINNHDQLVEALEGMIDMWETVCSLNGWDEGHMFQYQEAIDILRLTEGDQ